MAYTPATASSVKARFPAFSTVADGVIETALSEARRVVGENWFDEDRSQGEQLLCCHILTMDGLGATREAQLQGFSRLKLGSLELEREATGASASAYDATTFGKRFRQIMRRNIPPIIALNG